MPRHLHPRIPGPTWSVLRSLALVALAGAPAAAQERRVVLGGRDVVLWQPAGPHTVPQPVLIFSHGYGGCATQSRFLLSALAARGYWVVAPNHRDARCGTGERARPEEPFRAPERWNDRTYVDRADDIRAIQRALRDDGDLARRVDLARLGYLGHSLGGYTVLGLAGGWTSWNTPGLKAVLALSPYVQPFVAHRSLAGLTVPVMYQGGTLDFGITPWLRRRDGACDLSPAPRYCVIFSRAGHLAWTDLRAAAHQDMIDYAVAFFDHYVRGTPPAPLLTRATAGVAELRWASDLGSGSWRR